MKFSALVEHVSKKPIPPHVSYLIVEVMVSDENDEDVEVRFIYHARYANLKTRVSPRSPSSLYESNSKTDYALWFLT